MSAVARGPATSGLAATTDSAWEALAARLVARKQIDAPAMERAQRVALETRQRLDIVVTQLGLVSEKALAQTFADLLGIPVATPERFPEEPLLPERLKAKFLHKAQTLPLAIEQGRLVLAMANPLDTFTPAAIAAATDCSVSIEVAIPIELEAALNRLYPELSPPEADEGSIAAASEEVDQDTARLKDLASEAPVIRLVNQIIGTAVESNASDIHIEPFENLLRVRYRYDGVLHEMESPPARLTAAVVSRIKIMARLDIAERRLPQDGRIKLAVRGQEVDFRISTIPSLHGETVVLRVLDRTAVRLDYAKLGLAPDLTATFQGLLKLPNGLVLVTGPTGSGKTTTLYTGLRQINATERKIVTVEDPIEYQLPGINQIQVKPQIGLTFAQLLRSILRQDPDVIMVGEIRDLETAQIAAQSSLTGHLVLSTLHTNSAAATITRLRDMGLEDYLITAVLKGVLAQRLVRRLCTVCRRPFEAGSELLERLGLDRRTSTVSAVLFHSVGCPECRGTGYRGRQAIAELLLPNAEIEQLVLERANHTAIEKAAISAGMRTIFDAGLDAALEGVTTVEEVLRSVRAES